MAIKPGPNSSKSELKSTHSGKKADALLKVAEDNKKLLKKKFFAKPLLIRIDPPPGFTDTAIAEVEEIMASRVTAKKFDEVSSPKGAAEKPSKNKKKYEDGIFEGDMELAWELSLRSRCLSDVWVCISKKRVTNPIECQLFLEKSDLNIIFEAKTMFDVSCDSVASHLFHEGKIKGIFDQVTNEIFTPKLESPVSRVHISLKRDVCTLWVALNSLPLWKKGYKAHYEHAASLREDLAACAVRESLQLIKPNILDQIVIPFAGSGTLGFETARYLQRGIAQNFAVSGNAESSPFVPVGFYARYLNVKKRVEEGLPNEKKNPRVTLPHFQFCEIEKNVSELLSTNVKAFFKPRNSLASALFSIHNGNALEWKPEGKCIYLPLNPPYGDRLKSSSKLHKDIAGWVMTLAQSKKVIGFCLCGTEQQWKDFNLEVSKIEGEKGGKKLKCKTKNFMQGGNQVRMILFSNF